MELFKAHQQWANRPEDERFTSLTDLYTVWGMVQGLTRYSQSVPYADQRTVIDRAAGKLMEVEF